MNTKEYKNTNNTEHNIQMAIIYYLRVNNIFCFAVPNGGFRDKKLYQSKNGNIGCYSPTAKKLKREGVLAGVSDLILVLDSETVYVELKQPGKKQTPKQEEFEENIKMLNHRYLLWNCLEDAMEFVESIKT